uniref:Uncharacterized protein n=1 Tax=Arundo donax TaxID=35708 RepID=A0A0A9H4U0_ARUDO
MVVFTFAKVLHWLSQYICIIYSSCRCYSSANPMPNIVNFLISFA